MDLDDRPSIPEQIREKVKELNELVQKAADIHHLQVEYDYWEDRECGDAAPRMRLEVDIFKTEKF